MSTPEQRAPQAIRDCELMYTSPNATNADYRDSLTNSPRFPAENEGYSTNQELWDAPRVEKPAGHPQPSAAQQLSTALAHVDSTDIDQVLTIVATRPRFVGNHGGRPAMLDVEGKRKVCLLLKVGYTRSLAAAELGLSRSAITHAVRRDPEFLKQVLEAEELFERTPLLTIIEASQRNWRAAAWLMKHHTPHVSVNRRKRRLNNREMKQATSESLKALTST